MEEKTQKQNPYLIPGAIVLAGIIIAGAVFFNQNKGIFDETSNRSEAGAGTSVNEEPALSDIKVDFEGWPSIGKEDAPIVMVEYSDFACLFCKRFFDETEPLIKRDYIDTGKVRFVYKDFIVVGGDRAAEAAHCAQEQGKFWEYQALLFSRQAQDKANWADGKVHAGYAKELGLDEAALVQCFESRRYQEKVISSTQEAAQNGGQGTPYFLINGVPLFGAQPYSSFQQVIDSLLAKQ